MNFPKTYFEHGNYANYAERRDRYWKCAQELSGFLVRRGFLSPNGSVLDYGCAFGFLVEGLRAHGVRCDGYDISEFARQEAFKRGIDLVNFEPAEYDVLIALDVLEHMSDSQIESALKIFTASKLLVRIPCSVDGKTFHLKISQSDPTHINCKTKDQWYDFFNRLGYRFGYCLDLFTVYDSEGVLCALFSADPIVIR